MNKISVSDIQLQITQRLEAEGIVPTINAIVKYLRHGTARKATDRFNLVIDVLAADPALCKLFATRFHEWLAQAHIYPALVGLGIFSRTGFTREVSMRVYERFNPSYKDLNKLHDVFLYLFYSRHDQKWLQTITLRQWLNLYHLLKQHAEAESMTAAARQIWQARLHALEMLSIWVAAEELDPDFMRIEPKLLEVDSPFIALKREIAALEMHYQTSETRYDDAHIRVMLDQCRKVVERLRRKGTGVGAGSSVKMAHLLERLSQTLDRLELLLDVQMAEDTHTYQRLNLNLLYSLTVAAIEQRTTGLLWKRSVKMLARSISENSGDHGEHYITRNRSEYWGMLRSAAGAGVLIALMTLIKIHVNEQGYGEFKTMVLVSLNYAIGFMMIHMLHFTVATKQPAMTASSIAFEVERSDTGRAVNKKLATLFIDVVRSQSVAVFGNVSVAILLAAVISGLFAFYQHQPLLSTEMVSHQLKSIRPFTQPTLFYAAIAGVWLFCSGIIAGFFDNRANYLDLRKRLSVHPLLMKIMPKQLRICFANYMHVHYGSLAGNFFFGILLGVTGYIGYLLDLPLDIRHVAFSSANLGYAAISSNMSVFSFILGLLSVLLIGLINLWVSFTLALWVALRARDSKIDSFSMLASTIWTQIKENPLNLIFPVPVAAQVLKEAKETKKANEASEQNEKNR
ncbi:MAG: recombinase [Neisseria sp.]